MKFVPYLNFNGACREAFAFYAEVFGGEVADMMTFGDGPPETTDGMPPEAQGQILHASLKVGDAVLYASDAPGEMYATPQGLWVSVQIDTVAEAERVFAALEKGGNVTMPLDKTFWAERFGMVVDRFGTPWMIDVALAA